MLSPDRRHLLLDALRPPAGTTLDAAAGTTYSLDLVSLLAVPLACAAYDRQEADGSLARDPVAILQALRSLGDRITVFHGAGQLTLPPVQQRLTVFLEEVVHAVVPPRRTAIFHPKVWMLRFRSTEGADTRMRLVCLSRNLTADRSWDTVLTLDGVPSDRVHHPELEGFADALVTLAGTVRPLPAPRADLVRGLGRDLARTRWEPPPGFDRVAFWPLGHDRLERRPFHGGIRRMVVISPFLSAGSLDRIGRGRRTDILISRPEEMDRVGARALSRFAERLVLGPAAGSPPDPPLPDGPASAPITPPGADGRLSGLHAKVYVADVGAMLGRVWTGSANATDAAFGGNVELLVELEGPVRTAGVDALLGERPGALGLRSILEPYEAATEDGAPETESETARRLLDTARRELGSCPVRVSAVPLDGGRWLCEVRLDAVTDPLLRRELAGIRARIWLATLDPGTAEPFPAVDGVATAFRTSAAAVTPYLGIALALGDQEVRFAVVADLRGGPEDRSEQVLAQVVGDRESMLRLLLLLLGSTEAGLAGAAQDGGPGAGGRDPWLRAIETGALLEPLLRTYAREPARLRDVRRLIEQVRRARGGDPLLPEGWDAVWGPLAAALGREDAP